MTSTTALQDLLAPVHGDLRRMNREMRADLHPRSTELKPLIAHVSRYRGKQLRPALVFLAGRLFEAPGPAHFTCAKVVELIHMATLVHDDILDDAQVRRQSFTVNRLHGNEVPVLLGDYIYALAFQMSLQLDDMTCSRLLSDVTRVICQGEITQSLHRLATDWTEDNYYQVIGDKTASLYGAACKLGGHYAGANADVCSALWDFGYRLGMAFQIVDDCLDLCGDEAVVGKSLGTDLTTGKLTLPLLYLKNKGADGGRQLVALMTNGTSGNGAEANGDGTLLERLRREFAVDEAVSWSLSKAQRFVADARQALETLPASSA
ncbi:MAG: polyprenyl synthetase family protein, partial [Planctomycetota bacterium]